MKLLDHLVGFTAWLSMVVFEHSESAMLAAVVLVLYFALGLVEWLRLREVERYEAKYGPYVRGVS